METYFYAFVNDMILDLDFEQWLYEKVNDIEHFVDYELFLELYECDYHCTKTLSHIKWKISQYFDSQFKNIKKENFYDEIDDVLLNLIKRCEYENKLKGTLIINCSEILTPIDLQKKLRSICKFPNWYGLNWDAFNDLIDLSEVKKIELFDFNRMKKLIPYDAEKLLYMLEQNKIADCEIEIMS